MRAFRPCRRVSIENDILRFQSLGAMHGHHAHFVARDIHVAFDFALRRPNPIEEALQRRRLALLVSEREIEEFIERVGGLSAEPRENFGAAPSRHRAHARKIRMATNARAFRRKSSSARCAASANAGSSPALARSAGRSGPLRRIGERKELLVVRPNSGLFSTVASARSSSGSSSASPSTIRSMTAICSVRTKRSAPATSMPAPASARGSRPRTSGRAGAPGSARRAAACRSRSSAFTVRAILRGELDWRAGLAGSVEWCVPAFLARILVVRPDQHPRFPLRPGAASGKA